MPNVDFLPCAIYQRKTLDGENDQKPCDDKVHFFLIWQGKPALGNFSNLNMFQFSALFAAHSHFSLKQD